MSVNIALLLVAERSIGNHVGGAVNALTFGAEDDNVEVTDATAGGIRCRSR